LAPAKHQVRFTETGMKVRRQGFPHTFASYILKEAVAFEWAEIGESAAQLVSHVVMAAT
jgi:hypothetical protein